MNESPLRILLVEDNPQDADLLRETLVTVDASLEIRHVERLQQALECLHTATPLDAILLDLLLPDSLGLETLKQIDLAAPHLPILVLTGVEDEVLGVEAVRLGAQDYLVKGEAGGRRLLQLIRHAIQRKKLARVLGDHEARLEALIDSAMDAVIAVDVQQRVVLFNPAAETMFGCKAADALAGSIERFLPPAARQAHCAHVELFGATGVTNRRMGALGVLKGLRANGEEFPIEASISRVEAGGQKLFTVILRDVTERQRAVDALKALNETLEHRVAQRTAEVQQQSNLLRLLASELTKTEERERHRMAQLLHDHLQQLLVAARMSLARARRRVKEPAVDRLLGEVDGVLDESIRESRSLTAQLSPPVLYDAGLEAALRWLARDMAEKYRLTVEVEARAADEPADEATRILLFQAARELLFNVVKHARIACARLRLERIADGAMCLEVVDGGVGFDVPAEVGLGEGRGGFGLFHIRERISLVGGTMKIESSPSEGTRVTLVLPHDGSQPPAPGTEAGSSAIAALQTETPAAAAVPASPGGKLRVLVADDHPIVRKGLADLLREQKEIEIVLEAGDGPEAVDLCQRSTVDVVVMDVTMPRLDGIEATRRIKQSRPRTRIIGLSMHERADMAKAMLEAGATAYFRKDVPAETLISAILVPSASPSRRGSE
jgi:PAS domain S-box-containing protein